VSVVLDQLRHIKVVPVLRSPTVQEAVVTARGLAEGGMTVIELTYSTPGVLDAIRELAASPNLLVGAGTVLTPKQADDAIEAGARFVVSPVWLPWLPELARDRGVDSIPGAATPSEVWQAHCAGATAVKVFPIARLGGATYIRDLLAPMPQLRLMATGGVDAALARDLLAAGCVAVGAGRITTGNDDHLSGPERAKRFLQAVGQGSTI
jgi:2-dehydro-3-deoxyphosphogluconate aldolase/(4S)-4-hydroxy-2-oxoglutarate aldolase